MASLVMSFFGLVLGSLLLVRRLWMTLGPAEKRRQIPRPPLVPNWIPFVGSALSLAKGDEFWAKNEKKYGPAFRILAMGETRTFVTSPSLISHVFRNSKSFSGRKPTKTFMTRIYGLPCEVVQSEVVAEIMLDAHYRDLQSHAVYATISRYVDLLEIHMRSCFDEVGEKNGGEVDLSEMLYGIIYTASSKAFFSPSFPSRGTINPFLAFDQIVPLLALGSLPNILRRPAIAKREHLKDCVENWLGNANARGSRCDVRR